MPYEKTDWMNVDSDLEQSHLHQTNIRFSEWVAIRYLGSPVNDKGLANNA